MLHHNCAVFSLKNEDKYFFKQFNEHSCICGIADGHGGSGASKICRDYISELQSAPTSLDDLFLCLHQYCLQLPCQSGASLTVCIIDGNKIHCANVGDSHALIVTPTSYYWISESHRLQDNSGERTKLSQYIKYITDENGFPVGPPRLFPGGLACSRSVGDADCPHINCKPSISEAVMNPKDILIIASDGLWDSIRLTRICRIARETISASALCESANFKDDTSIIILSFSRERPLSLFRRISSNSSISSDDDNLPPRRVIRIKL